MQTKITLEYYTRPGESVYLVKDGKSLEMRYIFKGVWAVELDVPATAKTIEYSFELRKEGNVLRTEWGGHKVQLPTGKRKDFVLDVRDRWMERPADAPFWSKAFTQVIFRRPSRKAPAKGNVSFSIPFSQLRSDEELALTGSGPLFDDWKQFLPLSCETAPFWNIFLNVTEPFEYKFVILDSATGEPKLWESGPNHFFAEVPAKDALLVVRNMNPSFDLPQWKGAGTAVPVFSLRTKDSFGVGEFADIRKLADWVAATGQNLIQILPINDTTMTGTWQDSYPYNANSSFALHPMFLNLPAAGVKNDKAYKALQKELNDLPKVDYEKVNSEKTRLLREVFAKDGAKVLSSEAYVRFYAANEGWLKPYAVYCVLRDENGTAEFGKWKKLSRFDARKVDKYAAEHQQEVDFYCWEQFNLDLQLKDAVEYAHSKGVAIKGDLPIGIGADSADAWQFPRLFNMDSQAGAPPDAFSADGQVWGFPTYNWEEMAKDGYAWWKARLGKMSEYFDAFRIDHILGFFRIWEIPEGIKSGLKGHFNPALPYSADELRNKGFDPNSELFLPDPHKEGWYHPSIAGRDSEDYKTLNDSFKHEYDGLYYDFFYHRHNEFWAEGAKKKLSALLDSTSMLTCAEDLGMIPSCVPAVMDEFRILSLEVQRMPKDTGIEFGDPAFCPYRSVCTTGSHDTPTLRAWWEEDRERSERFYHNLLHCQGQAPYFCEPWVCELIVRQHLASTSMLCILPLQDWMGIDGSVRYPGDPTDEQINIPAIPRHYWRWRMHMNLEDLMEQRDFNQHLRDLVRSSRG